MKMFFLISLTFAWIFCSCQDETNDIIPSKDLGQLPQKENFDTLWRYNAFPTLSVINDKIICVFYQGYAHISAPVINHKDYEKGGRIMISFSYDNGSTWTSPETIIDTDFDDRDPNINIINGNNAILSFFRIDSDFNPHGMSFSNLINLNNSFENQLKIVSPSSLRNYLSSSPVRTISNENLIIGLYDDTKGDGAVSQSTDLGTSWGNPIEIPNINNLKIEGETDVIELSDGVLYSVLRTDWEYNMQYSFSLDYGLNWQNVGDIGFKGQAPYLFKINKDFVILAFRSELGTSLRTSRDGCKTWGSEYLISESLGAYPSIVQTGLDEILIAYYEEIHVARDGDYVESVIKFKRINLKNLQ